MVHYVQVLMADGKNVVPDVWEVLDQVKEFTDRVRSGEWRGATGEKITSVVAIGIGGSFLGPLFVHTALRTDQVNFHPPPLKTSQQHLVFAVLASTIPDWQSVHIFSNHYPSHHVPIESEPLLQHATNCGPFCMAEHTPSSPHHPTPPRQTNASLHLTSPPLLPSPSYTHKRYYTNKDYAVLVGSSY